MSIQFKPTPKRNPQNIEADPKYYATAVSKGKTDIDVLSKLVANASTVSRADTYAVIISLLETIMNELSEGRMVDLGKLGKFAVSLQSEGAEKPEELTMKQIKGARLNFTPGTELKEMLAALKYAKA